VLNLFSYTGGFSVQAALGGARRVTSVDVSRPAIEGARRNFAHNGLEPEAHGFVAENAFDYLNAVHERGERFDLVIVDPPSFAPNERTKPRALKAYTTLNRLALRVVEPGGWLISASCSSHVTVPDMMSILGAAGELSGRRTRVLQVRGAGSDHPVLPAFPEGQYLKVLLLWVE
jgi:23S rRNA (cytosine1962-C5)-methyltransferase